MRLFLDCEFTQLTAQAKLISLALVGQDRRGFYVEVIDAWREEDCSDFVKEIVLRQLWGGEYAMPIIEARAALLRFLATYDEELEIVTDAPAYDWELFCELAYDDGKWPQNVRNFPTDATALTATNDGRNCLTMPCSTPGSSQACSQLQRNHLTLNGLPEVLGHVVADVEVDWHPHNGLELILELGDVEQGNLAGNCRRDGGEQIEVTPFVIIASSDRAEEFGLSEAIRLDQASDVPFLSSYRFGKPHAFILESQPCWFNKHLGRRSSMAPAN